MAARRQELQPGAAVPESEVVDLTAAINNQVKIMRNWERQFDFIWETKFIRTPKLVSWIEDLEKDHGMFADLQSRINYINLNERDLGDSRREYQVSYGLSLKQAFELLEHYGVNMTFKAYAKIINLHGREVDWVMFPPKRGEKDYVEYMGVPRAGAHTRDIAKKALACRTDRYNWIPGEVRAEFSGQFKVKSRYWGSMIADSENLGWLRIAIWHEVMETAGIAMAVVGLYWPSELKQNLARDVDDNFCNEALLAEQSELYDNKLFRPVLYLEYELDPKLGFGDPPPYSSFESLAYWWEKEAERLEGNAENMEKVGNYSSAANHWHDAQQAWLKALKTWQSVELHPKRDERIKAAQKRLEEVTRREDQALRRIGARPLPIWQATGGLFKITITYSDWPDGLRARVKDPSNKTVAELRTNHPSGIITWGEGFPPGLYFFVADTSRYPVIPRVLKAVLTNPYYREIRPTAPSWGITGSGGEKITIHYSDWPNGFRAKILDYKERKVTEVSGTPGSKEGKVEWGKDAEAVDGVDNRLLFATIVHKER